MKAQYIHEIQDFKQGGNPYEKMRLGNRKKWKIELNYGSKYIRKILLDNINLESVRKEMIKLLSSYNADLISQNKYTIPWLKLFVLDDDDSWNEIIKERIKLVTNDFNIATMYRLIDNRKGWKIIPWTYI